MKGKKINPGSHQKRIKKNYSLVRPKTLEFLILTVEKGITESEKRSNKINELSARIIPEVGTLSLLFSFSGRLFDCGLLDYHDLLEIYAARTGLEVVSSRGRHEGYSVR